jgi:LacI family transcriptional regulator
MTQDQPRIPLAVVAAEAGVSVPTVSKVLNTRPDVAGATRARVTEVLERHGYRSRRG